MQFTLALVLLFLPVLCQSKEIKLVAVVGNRDVMRKLDDVVADDILCIAPASTDSTYVFKDEAQWKVVWPTEKAFELNKRVAWTKKDWTKNTDELLRVDTRIGANFERNSTWRNILQGVGHATDGFTFEPIFENEVWNGKLTYTKYHNPHSVRHLTFSCSTDEIMVIHLNGAPMNCEAQEDSESSCFECATLANFPGGRFTTGKTRTHVESLTESPVTKSLRKQKTLKKPLLSATNLDSTSSNAKRVRKKRSANVDRYMGGDKTMTLAKKNKERKWMAMVKEAEKKKKEAREEEEAREKEEAREEEEAREDEEILEPDE